MRKATAVWIFTAVWNSQDPAAWQMIMVLDANGGTMEGQPSQTYNALTPKYSGGTVYLCGYPTPEREGYHFAGWYLTTDEGDIRVETLPASRFLHKKAENRIITFRWNCT